LKYLQFLSARVTGTKLELQDGVALSVRRRDFRRWTDSSAAVAVERPRGGSCREPALALF
jgi:hypothetical protein